MQRFSSALEAYRANRFLNAFNLLFMAMALLYRVVLAISVLASEAAPFGVARSFKTFILILMTMGNDVVVLIVVNCAFLIGFWFFKPKAGTYSPAQVKRRNIYITAGFLMLIFWHTMISGSHLNLLFNMNSGFTLALFMEFFTILSLKDFIKLLGTRDFITILLPMAIFVVLWRRQNWRPRKRHIATLTVVVFTLLVAGPLLGSLKIPDELRMNPHTFFLRDLIRSFFKKNEAAKATTVTGRVFLADKLFAKGKLDNSDYSGGREYANVVIIVLESTASEYIFDTTKYAGGKMPMPYLHSIASKAMYMTKHFASNNSSPRSIFSIFSGLYESPQINFFSMEKNLKVPHLIDFLGKKYDSFLVTPADINWYFPKFWFKNRGFTQIHDYNVLKSLPEYKAGPTAVRDEFATVQFFLNTVAATKKPFLGIYYTFVGHWPYPEVSPEYQLIKGDSSRSRYINNLYAQDHIIKQIITGFEKTGKFDNTIFVIVGDHGEAFYQHPGNRVHSGESYNENIASPLIIYSPRYMKSERIDFPSVHADIVPTLLETLGIQFRKDQFQGESLLATPVRRYVFSYGNENTLTAISTDLKKMQILKKDEGGCRYFDLKRDSAELGNSECAKGSDQYRAIETFFRVQPGILKSYNDLCNSKGC